MVEMIPKIVPSPEYQLWREGFIGSQLRPSTAPLLHANPPKRVLPASFAASAVAVGALAAKGFVRTHRRRSGHISSAGPWGSAISTRQRQALVRCVLKCQRDGLESMPPVKQLRYFSASAQPEELAAALLEDGCAVIECLSEKEVLDKALEELSAGRLGVGQRNGPGTQLWRDPLKAEKEPAVVSLAKTPLLNQAAELIREAHAPGAARSVAWEVRWLDLPPTDDRMALHRDVVDTTRVPLERPLQWGLNAIWAATDFTADNGSTRVVPGSHSGTCVQGSWSGEEAFAEDFAKQAVMPAGSVVLYYASVLHGSCQNQTPSVRTGLNFNYCYIDEAGMRPADW